ncbi:hypothetical protein J520_0561 [Acinetobacter sp. 869535]|nr:hypothetical protein J520_0561 [Acinetobacter sp. 869535]EXE59055.1 hypothetical protein J579_0933 [Acinetobacter sp. 1239920]
MLENKFIEQPHQEKNDSDWNEDQVKIKIHELDDLLLLSFYF